ncbi:Hsp70-like protein [Histoplasma capsulatum]|uniref:Hsp70-like protein n=1 Tax=Ajellomyces capsulatus TaxID=5037 RepID=A0A8A1M617_AJECA|nr:Hsp70-like protein [Histoplasma capsulatum]
MAAGFRRRMKIKMACDCQLTHPPLVLHNPRFAGPIITHAETASDTRILVESRHTRNPDKQKAGGAKTWMVDDLVIITKLIITIIPLPGLVRTSPRAPVCHFQPSIVVDVMSSRFKSFAFGTKRKTASPPNPTPASGATHSPPPDANSSSASLPMNNPNQLGRPPSYTYNAGAGRPTSPMPPAQQLPPPINTGIAYPQAGYGGYPPHAPHGLQQQQQPISTYGRTHAGGELDATGRSKAQLIVGIDFGTTFSGVAFAFVTNTEAREDIITEWPGAGAHAKQKIPTVLYYDQYQKVVGWGPDIADALAPTGYPKQGVQKVEWFKLQLMLSGNTYIDPINLPPLPPGKSEIDVAADYLMKLRGAMRNQLQKTLGEVFNREERNIRYFLTVPAIWNDAGKAATRAAAIAAGFLRDENDNRLTLITEPEAAAMFCAKAGLLNLKIHDAILIVDCGGGTVDLIAYEVEEETPFTVAECTAGSGDSCGSTALNRNFSNILRAKIRKMKLPDGSRTAGRVYAKCIMDFENRIKADFRNNGQKWAVDVGIEADFPEAGIEEGYMTFTNEEILQCFEPVVNRILELVAPGATLMYEDILYACDEDVCPEYTKDPRIKEVVTLTSDLSRKNLEKDFERMDTPQGTFYRVYFDIYLTLDGSEFNAELVCQGEVMGRCSARFR